MTAVGLKMISLKMMEMDNLVLGCVLNYQLNHYVSDMLIMGVTGIKIITFVSDLR